MNLNTDWTQIPKGYYALPVCDYERYDQDDIPEVGLQTYCRKVRRTYKNGRTVGSDSFREGQTYVLDKEHEYAMAMGTWDRDEAIHIILSDPDHARQRYGQFTGRCGCCHKLLTDPKSKHLGIGPECRGFR